MNVKFDEQNTLIDNLLLGYERVAVTFFYPAGDPDQGGVDGSFLPEACHGALRDGAVDTLSSPGAFFLVVIKGFTVFHHTDTGDAA